MAYIFHLFLNLCICSSLKINAGNINLTKTNYSFRGVEAFLKLWCPAEIQLFKRKQFGFLNLNNSQKLIEDFRDSLSALASVKNVIS